MSIQTPKVRTRFAPSPTGLLHIGGIRSALFNYLYAKKHGGDFILRLEDTDRERFVPEAEDHLLASLSWLGISPDEGVGGTDKGYGPYTQSERLDIYKEYADKLVASGHLYPCWCSAERLAGLREQAQKQKAAFKYDRHCLGSPGDPNAPHVLRFKVPTDEKVSWDDAVRGRLEFNSNDIDDYVAIKSDGFPTYQFASVVDDRLMEISHVLRADEWIPSTPKHVLLYQAFGWEHPEFAHLPAVVPPGGGKKLSKRHGAKSALELRDEGYVPGAVVNFLAMLGWNQGEGSTKEVYTQAELIDAFSLERIQKSPAVFDAERLTWMNGEYIRTVLSEQDYLSHAKAFLSKADYSVNRDDSYISKVLLLDRERIKTFADVVEIVEFFFVAPTWDSERLSLLTAKADTGEVGGWLGYAKTAIDDTDGSVDQLERALRQVVDSKEIHTGKFFYAIRVAVTGRTAAPGLFETIATLGVEESKTRIDSAISALG